MYVKATHPRGEGTVDVYIVGEAGQASQELIDEVQAVIDAKRPICADVLVRTPRTLVVDFELTVWLQPGFDQSTADSAIRDAVAALFDIRRLGVGNPLPLATVVDAVMEVEGVQNVHITAPVEDIDPDEDELPALGSVSIGWQEGW